MAINMSVRESHTNRRTRERKVSASKTNRTHQIKTTGMPSATSPRIVRPTNDDATAWQAYWAAQGQSWRTAPEIAPDRQAYLAERRATPADVMAGTYPLKGVAPPLTRADVEWLLATHEDGRGPVDWSDPKQRNRVGIDLRGADLSHRDLSNLPLTRMLADIAWREHADLTAEQHAMSAVSFENADLKGAHLEGAGLEYANFRKADVRLAHLEEVRLGAAECDGAFLAFAHLEGADLSLAHLDDAFLWGAFLADATLHETHLEGAHLDGAVLADADHIGPRLVDVRWGDANLAVIDWSQLHMLAEEAIARKIKLAEPEAPIDAPVTQSGGNDALRPAPPRDEQFAPYDDAVRANRQLALALRGQGLNEDADRFAYRAQVLQRAVFRRRRKYGAYLFSWFLDGVAGYGYHMQRIVFTYASALLLFAVAYYVVGALSGAPMSAGVAIITSITAFHGRVFAAGFKAGDALSWVTAAEALVGVIVEGVFIAMLTQRFFGR